jgi:hypothetical protein
MEVKNYPNYLIYNDGRVYSKKRKIFLKQFRRNIDNYLCVYLCMNGKYKNYNIHRLVGEHYLPLVEGKDMIDHIDRNKTNNNVSNLRWCNHSENGRNIGFQRNNKLKHKHITKTKWNTFTFIIKRSNIGFSKTFKILDECIEYRNNFIKEHFMEILLPDD